MADYRYNNPNELKLTDVLDQANKLREFLQKPKLLEQSHQQDLSKLGVAQQGDLEKLAQQHALDQSGTEERFRQAQDFSKTHPDVSISLSKEGASIGGRDPLRDLLRGQEIKRKEDENVERAVTTMGTRLEKQDIPKVIGSMKELRTIMPPGSESKSMGGWKGYLPNSLVRLGEEIGIPSLKGATQERQANEALKMILRHPIFGSAITAQERASFEEGLDPRKGTPAAREAVVKRLNDIVLNNLKNIESSTRPEAVSRFRERDGISSSDLQKFLSPPQPSQTSPTPAPQTTGLSTTPPSETPEQKYMRLKQKYGR